jgi:hypothetical protein
MTATLSGATSLEQALGTVGEAMTPEVVTLEVGTPADDGIQLTGPFHRHERRLPPTGSAT